MKALGNLLSESLQLQSLSRIFLFLYFLYFLQSNNVCNEDQMVHYNILRLDLFLFRTYSSTTYSSFFSSSIQNVIIGVL